MNVNEKTVARIDRTLPSVHDDNDQRVLSYIKGELQPERLKARADNDVLGSDGSAGLRLTAGERLRRWESESVRREEEAVTDEV